MSLHDATSRALAEQGLDALTLEHVAKAAGVPVDQLPYGSIAEALREMVLSTFEQLELAVSAAVSDADDGSDAMTRYVTALVRHFEPRMDSFRAAYMQRQIAGNDRFGLDLDTMRARLFPAVKRSIDPLEEKLTADRGPSELAGGIHPRRLAFVTHMAATGLMMTLGLQASTGTEMLHTSDDLLKEITMALGAATTTLRQMSALSGVGQRLAQMRSEHDLRAAIGELATTALEMDEAAVWRVTDGELSAARPDVVDEAFAGRAVAHAEGRGGKTDIAAPVITDDAVDSVLLCSQRTSVGERDLARVGTFATMVGIALENVRLYENLHARVDAATKELREAQAALVQSEKMAATGTLVAGLAHELNTPMASMLASQQTLAKAIDRLDLGEDRMAKVIRNACDTIGSGGARIGTIIDQLMRFSRVDASEVAVIDLNVALRDCIALVRSELPRGATVGEQLGELPELSCQPAQLNQLFYNVMLNAAQALDEGGTLQVASRSDGDNIIIGIIDDGCGIDADTISKIFDPGFTTKGVGVGAGLGMSIAYQTVVAHGGDIDVESEPGEGTTVTIRLPLSH